LNTGKHLLNSGRGSLNALTFVSITKKEYRNDKNFALKAGKQTSSSVIPVWNEAKSLSSGQIYVPNAKRRRFFAF
jgi:hypothetical protein